MCGKAGAWLGGGHNVWSGSSVGAEMHHTSWRVMYHSCWRMMHHEQDDGRCGSTNRCMRDMQMRGRGKGVPWVLAG